MLQISNPFFFFSLNWEVKNKKQNGAKHQSHLQPRDSLLKFMLPFHVTSNFKHPLATTRYSLSLSKIQKNKKQKLKKAYLTKIKG